MLLFQKKICVPGKLKIPQISSPVLASDGKLNQIKLTYCGPLGGKEYLNRDVGMWSLALTSGWVAWGTVAQRCIAGDACTVPNLELQAPQPLHNALKAQSREHTQAGKHTVLGGWPFLMGQREGKQNVVRKDDKNNPTNTMQQNACISG